MRKTLTALAITTIAMGGMAATSGAAHAADVSIAPIAPPPLCTIRDIPDARYDPYTGQVIIDLTIDARCFGFLATA